MTKQLLTLLTLFCVAFSFAKGEGNPMLYKAEEKKDEFQFDLISKLQASKTGSFLTCNLRLKNTSDEVKYIESIKVVIEMEAKNLKNGNTENLEQEFLFDQDWLVASNDFAFYQPRNKSLLNKETHQINKIISCRVTTIEAQKGTESDISSKDCTFDEKLTLGLVETILVNANFHKESDSSPGYYKNGLDLKSVGHSVKVYCTLDLNNSSSKAIKMKKDVNIGVEIGGKYYFKKLKAQKLKSKEKKTENLFSVKLSDKLKSEKIKAGIEP